MKYLGLLALFMMSPAFASDTLSLDISEGVSRGCLTLEISNEGRIAYAHNPYPGLNSTTAINIGVLSERIANKFQSNVPHEFPVLLKLLDRVSPVNEGDSSSIEATKNYITKTLELYLLETAVKLCEITPPTNENEQAVAIRQLQESLQVLSNVKGTLVGDVTEYNKALKVLYTLLIDFADSEYYRLRQLSAFNDATMIQYNQIIAFFSSLDLRMFKPEDAQKLKCYHVTMLLAGANIAGIQRDNQKQLQYASTAEEVTTTIASDVNNAYKDNSNFLRKAVRYQCQKIQKRAKEFLNKDNTLTALSAATTHVAPPRMAIPRHTHRGQRGRKKN